MDEELRETLHSLGIRDGGALAALSADDVERRWGPEGLAAWLAFTRLPKLGTYRIAGHSAG